MRAHARPNSEMGAMGIPADLKCGICEKLLRDAVSVSCCKNNYCNECESFFFMKHLLTSFLLTYFLSLIGISYSLLENPDVSMRFKCPSCRKYQSPEMLVPNSQSRDAVAKYTRVSEEKRLRESTAKQSDLNSEETHL
jgi:hypothetical protein